MLGAGAAGGRRVLEGAAEALRCPSPPCRKLGTLGERTRRSDPTAYVFKKSSDTEIRKGLWQRSAPLGTRMTQAKENKGPK